MSPRQMFRGQRDGFRIGDDMGQVYAGLAGVLSQYIAKHTVVDEPETDQLATQRQAADRLLHQGDAQLVGADKTLPGEPFT